MNEPGPHEVIEQQAQQIASLKSECAELRASLAKAQKELADRAHHHDIEHRKLADEHHALKQRINPPEPTKWKDGEYYNRQEDAWRPCRVGPTVDGWTLIEVPHRIGKIERALHPKLPMGHVRIREGAPA